VLPGSADCGKDGSGSVGQQGGKFLSRRPGRDAPALAVWREADFSTVCIRWILLAGRSVPAGGIKAGVGQLLVVPGRVLKVEREGGPDPEGDHGGIRLDKRREPHLAGGQVVGRHSGLMRDRGRRTLEHDQGPRLRQQDAEDDPLAGPYPGQFLAAFVAAGEPVPHGRDEMLGDLELIIVPGYLVCMTVCGLAAATGHRQPPDVLTHRAGQRPVKGCTRLSR
jgi:hypothetical protein